MTNTKTLHLIGYASGLAAGDKGCGKGPSVLYKSPYSSAIQEQGIRIHWENKIKPPLFYPWSKVQKIAQLCQDLALKVHLLAKDKQFFTVLGGDHSCAIGTWSGVHQALGQAASLGLIWIDAHMDSHTTDTTPSGNIHGMPLATLLGYGDPQFTQLMNPHVKLNPRNVCLIGIRSFEPGELELLERLKVRIFYMDEIKQRGLDAVMAEAVELVSQQTAGFGVSLDIDSIDPLQAPGTGCPEPGGLSAKELCQSLKLIANYSPLKTGTTHPKLIGAEIVEFNPRLDRDHLTEKLVYELISSLTLGK